MGFQVSKIKEVKRKVEFDLPCSEGEQPERADFVVTFKVRDVATTKKRAQELLSAMANYSQEVRRTASEPNYQPQNDPTAMEEGFLAEDVVNIEGIFAEDGQEVAFSPEVLKAVLNDLVSRLALLKAWNEFNQEGALKRKN